MTKPAGTSCHTCETARQLHSWYAISVLQTQRKKCICRWSVFLSFKRVTIHHFATVIKGPKINPKLMTLWSQNLYIQSFLRARDIRQRFDLFNILGNKRRHTCTYKKWMQWVEYGRLHLHTSIRAISLVEALFSRLPNASVPRALSLNRNRAS